MRNKKTLQAFKRFGSNVIRSAQKYLDRGGEHGPTNVTGALRNSLTYKIQPTGKDSYTMYFGGKDYAEKIDKGVSGSEEEQTYTTYKGERTSTSLKYGSGVEYPEKASLVKWIAKRGIGKRGKVPKKTIAHLMSLSMARIGSPGTSFYQTAMYDHLESFPDQIARGYKDDVVLYYKSLNVLD